jgi:hypothetical protein
VNTNTVTALRIIVVGIRNQVIILICSPRRAGGKRRVDRFTGSVRSFGGMPSDGTIVTSFSITQPGAKGSDIDTVSYSQEIPEYD